MYSMISSVSDSCGTVPPEKVDVDSVLEEMLYHKIYGDAPARNPFYSNSEILDLAVQIVIRKLDWKIDLKTPWRRS